MGADFLPEGGKNASKFVVPPEMALGEGILFPCVGEGWRGEGGGGKPYFLGGNWDFFYKRKE